MTTKLNTSSSHWAFYAILLLTVLANQCVGGGRLDLEPWSSEARLQQLLVAETNITPDFSPDIYSYESGLVSVKGLNISAVPLHNKAVVKGAGYVSLKYGTNLIAVQVTAEDGTSTSYQITLFRQPPVNSLYFKATDDIHGGELWVTDGIEIPVMLHDINPDKSVWGGDGYFANEVIFQGQLCFQGVHAANDYSGFRLFCYDRTGPPYEMSSKIGGIWPINTSHFVVLNDQLYFIAYSSGHGREIWRFDGINPPVLALETAPGESTLWPLNLYSFAGKLLYSAKTEAYGRELYIWDGTNPPVLHDLNPYYDGNSSSSHALGSDKVEFDGALYFIASSTQRKLYRYTGAAVEIVDVDNLNVASLVAMGGYMYYYAVSNMTTDIIRYDGINAPVALNQTALNIFDLVGTVNGRILLDASTEQSGSGAYLFDGTNAPTYIEGSNLGSASPYFNLAYNYNGLLYFRCNFYNDGSGLSDAELCTWDGTGPLKQIDLPGTGSSGPGGFIAY